MPGASGCEPLEAAALRHRRSAAKRFVHPLPQTSAPLAPSLGSAGRGGGLGRGRATRYSLPPSQPSPASGGRSNYLSKCRLGCEPLEAAALPHRLSAAKRLVHHLPQTSAPRPLPRVRRTRGRDGEGASAAVLPTPIPTFPRKRGKEQLLEQMSNCYGLPG
jgi:hypothetical protein